MHRRDIDKQLNHHNNSRDEVLSGHGAVTLTVPQADEVVSLVHETVRLGLSVPLPFFYRASETQRDLLAVHCQAEEDWMATATGGKTSATKASKTKKEAAERLKLAQRAATLLKQVSDPTRLQVILMLDEGEKHVGALSEHLNQSQPAVSHHLALLRHGGIIAPRRQGKNNFYALTEVGEDLAKVVKTVIA